MRETTHKEPSEKTARTSIGSCFGTFGELLQGVLPDRKREFLVTLPIDRYSTAKFTPLSGSRKVYVYPSHNQKSRRLAERLIEVFDLDSGGVLSLRSELPTGKGCASSSADMVSTARAIQSAFGLTISRETLAEVMGDIEPTDGVMYRGIVSFYHREGILKRFLGYLPPLTIVGLDEGGQVDTVEFNARPKMHGQARRAEYENLLFEVERAIALGDLRTVGEISTRSAILNQEVLPKAQLNLFLDMRRRYEALGVIVAHSGTHLGLLFDPRASDHLRVLPEIVSELKQYSSSASIYRTHDFQCDTQKP